MSKTIEAPEPFVDGGPVAAMLGKDDRYLRMNAERLGIPRYKLGQQWRYRLSEVAEWMTQQTASAR